MGYGCLGEENDLRLQYGLEACSELPDCYVMDIYNKIRQILGLPITVEVASFDSVQYCRERSIPFKRDIPKEYQLMIEFIIGVK